MHGLGERTPEVRAPLPGDVGRAWVDRLAAVECPAFTARRKRRAETTGAPHDPIVWTEARGANVVDVEGNVYVDFTSGFGVASVGHAHPEVVAAVRAQSERLLHALGDVFPSDVKILLLEELARLAPFEDAKTLLCTNGADAVETALKTAALATGRPGIVAFEGGYHGLSHGPLAACGYSASFRAPFAAQLNPHVTFVPWPHEDVEASLAALDRALGPEVGAVLVEPVLGRGGVFPAPEGFLARLGEVTRAHGALVIADEVFTGFGRCGARFRSVADGLLADLLCVGKSLGGGMPISACIGRPEVMSAWGDPGGEAIHTGTFYGHPLACAASLAALAIIERDGLAERARDVGGRWAKALAAAAPKSVREVRQAGLFLGVQLDRPGAALGPMRALLERGFIVLPAGADASVLQLVPPLVVDEALLDAFVPVLASVLEAS